jgi:hypothetical protein
MTHDELVQKANVIFEAIKKRDDLYFSGRTELTENEHAEVMDHCKDVERVVALETQGVGKVGNADCFAIANVLLRAINRQWWEPLSPEADADEAPF